MFFRTNVSIGVNMSVQFGENKGVTIGGKLVGLNMGLHMDVNLGVKWV